MPLDGAALLGTRERGPLEISTMLELLICLTSCATAPEVGSSRALMSSTLSVSICAALAGRCCSFRSSSTRYCEHGRPMSLTGATDVSRKPNSLSSKTNEAETSGIENKERGVFLSATLCGGVCSGATPSSRVFFFWLDTSQPSSSMSSIATYFGWENLTQSHCAY
ncbi:hypothetical protein EDD36DRAFT_271756 [Exophiala viscosa]|uniref:Uncharacterized protein n=1 Tax=Exophiala viscosa TaxID=2486360 RepID=A0AAN6DV81_9EURO|nr:hypothetical protein EDD36DRAFT_271756 [Exophiala viscosa]